MSSTARRARTLLTDDLPLELGQALATDQGLTPADLADLWVDLVDTLALLKRLAPTVGAELCGRLADDEEIEAYDGSVLQPRRNKKTRAGVRDTIRRIHPDRVVEPDP